MGIAIVLAILTIIAVIVALSLGVTFKTIAMIFLGCVIILLILFILSRVL